VGARQGARAEVLVAAVGAINSPLYYFFYSVNIMSKNELLNSINNSLLPRIQKKVKCVIIFGSRVKGEKTHNISDIDFFYIVKNSSDPQIVTKDILMFFDKKKIKCDFFWYLEDPFNLIIEKGIDLGLWHQIFGKGQILYCDKYLLRKIRKIFSESSPVNILFNTYQYRREKSRELEQSLIRNLHRILLDAIWALYSREKKISQWSELPDYDGIVKKAYTEKIIPKEIFNLASRVLILRKKMEKEKCNLNFNDFDKISKKVSDFINKNELLIQC
jgi:predicted nucleotidyltransferase